MNINIIDGAKFQKSKTGVVWGAWDSRTHTNSKKTAVHGYGYIAMFVPALMISDPPEMRYSYLPPYPIPADNHSGQVYFWYV